MPVAYLGLGSNLDAEQKMRLAMREIRARFSLQKVSPVYRSEALGFQGADFLNAVVCVETGLTPLELCAELDIIHDLAGRRRKPEKYISRTLDIDLLLYDGLVMHEDGVRLPRKDVLQYSFVLKPLADIAADYRHPLSGKLIGDHWREFDAASHPLTEVDLVL